MTNKMGEVKIELDGHYVYINNIEEGQVVRNKKIILSPKNYNWTLKEEDGWMVLRAIKK